MKRFSILLFSILLQLENISAQVIEPYHLLHGGAYSGTGIKASPDPLIRYRWNEPKASDSLQIYFLQPTKTTATPTASFQISNSGIIVRGKGDLSFDFGQENAGWMEFESDDLEDSVEMSISEYNEPAIVNSGAQHPIKTLHPRKYGSIYRLQLNDELYEGVRFGWIHVRTFSKLWHIRNVKLVCQVKPVNYLGSFECNDPVLNAIWYTGAYVVKLNMLQDFFGAILMERSDRHSWTGDAYPAQAAALTAFGNYDVVKKNIAFTSSQDNGIAAYSMYWVLSLVDYFNYSGDSAFLKAYSGNADKRLEKAYADYRHLPALNFMGWDERLGAGFENPQNQESQNAYKMLCINAWKQFSVAMETIHDTALASRYRQFATSETEALEANTNMAGEFGIHAVSEAINAGLITNSKIETASQALFADRLNRLSYSPFNQYFIIQAMALAGRCDLALTTVKDCWGGQLAYGGTSFFEVYRPSWNTILKPNDPPVNNQCGYTSLAHPWGAGVTKWLSENILGIRPNKPGFKVFSIVPFLQDTLNHVKGTVPTPYGNISADFNCVSGFSKVIIPAGTVAAKIGIPKAGRTIVSITINGKSYGSTSRNLVHNLFGEDSNYLYLKNIKAGIYNIRTTYTAPLGHSLKQPDAFNYPVKSFTVDSISKGRWRNVYGKEGYIIFGKHGNEKLPLYIDSVHIMKEGTVIWDSASEDPRVLQEVTGEKKIAAAIVTKDPDPTYQTMTLDVESRPGHPYTVSLYFLDYDEKDRRSAIEIFDLRTLNIIAPVQLISNYEDGKYLRFTADGPVRLRINQVRGMNAAVSGIFFDKPFK